MKRLPFSEQPEHSQKPKPSKYCECGYLLVLLIGSLIFLFLIQNNLNYRKYYDDSIELVEGVAGISFNSETYHLNNQLAHEYPGGVLVEFLKGVGFFGAYGVPVHTKSDGVECDHEQDQQLKVVVLTDGVEKLKYAGFYV